MKKKQKKLSEQAIDKVNRKSAEFGTIPDADEKDGKDEFSTESEDTLHSNKQINKNLGEY